MKTVSNNFLTAWASKGVKFAIQRIDYKRQYWNGSAMVYEANWQSLTMPQAQFKTIGTMSWTLDTILLNQFKASNCVVQLLNNDYRWSPNNSAGIFAPDPSGNVNVAIGTKFQIYAGYELADGSFEYVSMFAGILTDYSMKPVDGVFEAFIDGYEYNLRSTDAQLLVTAVTNESLGTGDGATTSFKTLSTGVAFIDTVKAGGSTKTEGIDYSIGGLDAPSFNANGPASVSFVNAPGNGVALTWSGRKWYAAQKIESLVTSLLNLAGFSSSQYSVQAVTFPNGVVSSFLLNSVPQFSPGTFSDTAYVSAGGAGSDYVKIASGVIDDFETGGVGAWTQNGSSWRAFPNGSAIYDATSGASGGGFMAKASSKNTGIWQIRVRPNAVQGTINYYFMNSANNAPGNGYMMSVTTSLAGASFNKFAVTNVSLYRLDAGVATLLTSWTTPSTGTPLYPGTAALSPYTLISICVVRDSSGNMALFLSTNGDNGQYVGPTVVDNTYTVSTFVGMSVTWPGGTATPGGIVYDLFTYSSTDTTYPYAYWITGEQNALGITAWTNMQYTAASAPAASFLFQTQVSSVSGSGYDPFVNDPVTPGTSTYPILSATKQYLKAKVFFMWDPSVVTSINTVQFKSLFIGYSSTITSVALAVFRGMDCYSAIQALAFISNYEIGFDSTGTFFFRPKNLNNTPLLTFKQSDILSKIEEIKPGWREVQNDIQVTFGSSYGITRGTSYKEYNYNSLPEARPSSYDKFRQRLNSQSQTNFLFSNDGNVAAGMAQAIHDDNYLEKRRVTMLCRLIPQIEIGDVISVSHYEDPLMENNWFGDPLVTWAPIFGLPPQVALRTFKCKVLQLTHDFNAETTRILGLEVLT